MVDIPASEREADPTTDLVPFGKPLSPGDRVRFRSNGVAGVVVTNHGPAVNTETGNDVITWRVPIDGDCVHDSAKLERQDDAMGIITVADLEHLRRVNDGTVPQWLKDPKVTGEAAANSWGWKGGKK